MIVRRERRAGVGRTLARRTRAAFLVFAGLGAAGAGSAAAQNSWPVDRWLVAEAHAPADSAPGVPESEDALETDLLAAPGEAGVLPDRGRSVAGVTWRMVRRDGIVPVSLDSILDEPRAGTVAYAHAYVRLPADRTLRLRWSGVDCTEAAAWLNGRRIEGGATGDEVMARFGAGWNTLLLKLRAGDCPYGFRATLAPGSPDTSAGDAAGDDGDDDRPRVQASRPHGDVRTGPEDWVVPTDSARIGPDRRWRGDRLYAGLLVELTAWGRAAVSDVKLELHGGPDGEAAAPWLVPGKPVEVVVPVRLDRLDRLRDAGNVGLRLRWDDREVERRLRVVGAPPGASERIALDGWTVRRSGAETADEPGTKLPNGAGWLLEGEWEVPAALAGRPLVLETAAAPGEYVLNGTPVRNPTEEFTLCAPCARGVELRITATSSDGWTAPPTVRIGDGPREG